MVIQGLSVRIEMRDGLRAAQIITTQHAGVSEVLVDGAETARGSNGHNQRAPQAFSQVSLIHAARNLSMVLSQRTSLPRSEMELGTPAEVGGSL
jgi:hypothetical protein